MEADGDKRVFFGLRDLSRQVLPSTSSGSDTQFRAPPAPVPSPHGSSSPPRLTADVEEMGYDQNPDDDPDRYLLIEPLDSRTGFRCMERFVEDLADGECKRSLIRALRGPRPFASFRNVIDDFGDERKQWFEYHDNWLLEEARSFIEDNDLGTITDAPKCPP